MNRDELENFIKTLSGDMEFEYLGVWGSICPINAKKVGICYGDFAHVLNDINLVMSYKFINGKSLNELCDLIDFDY